MRPEPGSGGELHRGRRHGADCSADRRAPQRASTSRCRSCTGRTARTARCRDSSSWPACPYCGCDVASAAVSMDKRLARTTLRGAGLPVLDDVAVARARWLARTPATCVRRPRARAPDIRCTSSHGGSGRASASRESRRASSSRRRSISRSGTTRRSSPRRRRTASSRSTAPCSVRVTTSRCRCASNR